MKGNTTSVKKISKFLRKKISSNTLKPGTHICENTLSREFNVSRVPVRESFRILQSEGYLELIPNKGCFVKKISPEFINETTIVYSQIAPVVLRNAIPNYTEKTYKKAEIILDKIENRKNNDDVGYLLWEFAIVIYSPSNMKYMVGLFDIIYENSVRLLNEFFENKKIASFKISAHRNFIKLCREKEHDKAIAYWEDFLLKLENIVTESVEE